MPHKTTLSWQGNSEFLQKLHDHHLFSGLSVAQFEQLITACNCCSLEMGEQLFTQRDIAKQFYFLREGQVKLYRTSRDGGEKVIEIIDHGQFFAEALALMPVNSHYPLIAEALTECQLISFDNSSFLGILTESVDTCMAVMREMARRLHHLLNEIDNLALHNATYRLINFLLHQCDTLKNTESSALSLTLSKQVIASRLSIKPETLSRILSSLSSKKLIQVDRQYIVLVDLPALKKYISEN